MIEFHSYPKVLALGHRDILNILDGPVYLQEKVDGSQINFMWDEKGDLHVRSRGGWQYGGPENRVTPDKMFLPAIQFMLELDPQTPDITFRGEMLNKPKHNTLSYERVPEGFLVLFDIVDHGWNVPAFYEWNGGNPYEWIPLVGPVEGDQTIVEKIEQLMKEPPLLGGAMREGIVVKNYDRFTPDGKMMVGKYVAPEFKEKHMKEWKSSNPGSGDFVQGIIESLNTEARWQKGVQHLEEQGKLLGEPRDIGPLISEIKRDTLEEERDWILDQLATHFMPIIERGIGRGAAEWYKEQLFNNIKA